MAAEKLRVVVCTDISTLTANTGEPDDTESMVRFLLYSCEWDVEGLIATSTLCDNLCHPDYIRTMIGYYDQVRPNLLLHDSRYPTAQSLLDMVKGGQNDRNTIGAGHDTEGSDWIISVIDKPDTRPVWIIFWGGGRELAQALYKVQQTRSAADFATFKSKIRVYAIGDQDNTCQYMKINYPDMFYITNMAGMRGMYRDGDTSLCTPDWVTTNILTGHGALAAAYPLYNGGDPWGEVHGIKEGDTPSFLYLMPTGLGDPVHPTWGCWGGRMLGTGPQYIETNAKDTVGADTSERATIYRWRPAYQADFQARLDWCVQPYAGANHAPKAFVAGALQRTVAQGAPIQLDAEGSTDPDGNALSYNWSVYKEAGTYTGNITIINSDKHHAKFRAPDVTSLQTIHVILAVTDNGTPALCSYKRVIITVDPGLPHA